MSNSDHSVSPEQPDVHERNRLEQAERQGLRLAILCRTIAVGFALAWLVASGYDPRISAIVALVGFTLIGVIHLSVIGTRFDRWWMKYAIYALDILGMCAMFVLIPVSRAAEVPQIIAFRAYGIYYLFPLIAMACLSLSWRLVLWSGLIAVIGWWSAFLVVVSGMDVRFDWGDIPVLATYADYEAIFLSSNFIGTGNRVEETGLLFVAAAVLSFAVFRARQVFFKQVAAEQERETERAAKQEVAATLGRYVPEAVVDEVLKSRGALSPQMRDGSVLTLDIAGFSKYASDKEPTEVIGQLNAFLAGAVDVISRHRGVVITYTGDGFIAAFNVPLALDDPVRHALEAARQLLDYARQTTFAVRLGIASGPVASGSVGSSDRQAFTIYGDTVNRSARFDQLCKEIDASVAIDEATARVAKAMGREAKSLGKHDLRGAGEGLQEVFGF